jgi:hypothetical protein
MTAPAVQEEAPVQKAQGPGFGELKEQIRGALATYKKRGESITALEQALSKARKAEADCLKRSLTDDDPKVVKRIAEARVEIEVASRRLTFSQQSLPASLEDVVAPMRQLQAQLVQQLVNLKAQRIPGPITKSSPRSSTWKLWTGFSFTTVWCGIRSGRLQLLALMCSRSNDNSHI